MDWFRRLGGARPGVAPSTDEPVVESVEQAAPGVAALLEGVSEDRRHSILDLGRASESSLRVYSRFARRVRFADALADPSRSRGPEGTRAALPAQPEQPYNLVFGWDMLDRLYPEEIPRVVARLAEIASDDARLHVVIDASDGDTRRPLRFSLLDQGGMSYEAEGPARPARRSLLPTEVANLLSPFHVERAFTLKAGLREYVAFRREGSPNGGRSR